MDDRFDVLDTTCMTGTIKAQVVDPDLDPNHVLEHKMPWSIQVDWTIQGTTAGGDRSVASLEGKWRVSAYAESVCGGTEGLIADATVALGTQPAVSPRNYNTTLNIPAETLEPGAYEIIVLLNYENSGGPARMGGFTEAGMIQIYDF